MIVELSSLQFAMEAHEVASEVARRSGYIAELKSTLTIENTARLEYVEELLNSIKEFCEAPENKNPDDENQLITIRDYLENVALITDMDNEKSEDRNKVTLMTVHAANGLEFSYVYVTGMEETLFPGARSIYSDEDLEEERRLFYVAITRAKSKVTVSYAATRYRWGEPVSNNPSRFLREIDKQYFEKPIAAKGVVTDDDDPQTGDGEHAAWGNKGSRFAKRTPKQPFREQKRDFTPDRPEDLSEGMTIEHDRFGTGVIARLEGEPYIKAIVDFEQAGRKTLLMQYAKVRIVKR
jgi:DNA helicase-2/ATP-dependent DNA helicase PcrA